MELASLEFLALAVPAGPPPVPASGLMPARAGRPTLSDRPGLGYDPDPDMPKRAA